MALPRRKRAAQTAETENERLAGELGRQTTSEIRRLRNHARLELRLDLKLCPGSLSQGRQAIANGHTLDVSSGGCRARLDAAAMPGDVFMMELGGADHELPKVHALCLRTALVGDDEFESAFRFLSTIDQTLLGGDPGDEGLLD